MSKISCTIYKVDVYYTVSSWQETRKKKFVVIESFEAFASEATYLSIAWIIAKSFYKVKYKLEFYNGNRNKL